MTFSSRICWAESEAKKRPQLRAHQLLIAGGLSEGRSPRRFDQKPAQLRLSGNAREIQLEGADESTAGGAAACRGPAGKQAQKRKPQKWPHREGGLAEWSKGVDSSSTSESGVGSNPTAVSRGFPNTPQTAEKRESATFDCFHHENVPSLQGDLHPISKLACVCPPALFLHAVQLESGGLPTLERRAEMGVPPTPNSR